MLIGFMQSSANHPVTGCVLTVRLQCMTLQQPRALHLEAPPQRKSVQVGCHPVLWRRRQQRESPCPRASAGQKAAQRAVVQAGPSPRAKDFHDGQHQVLLSAPFALRQRDLEVVSRVAHPGVVGSHSVGEALGARGLPRKELLCAAHAQGARDSRSRGAPGGHVGGFPTGFGGSCGEAAVSERLHRSLVHELRAQEVVRQALRSPAEHSAGLLDPEAGGHGLVQGLAENPQGLRNLAHGSGAAPGAGGQLRPVVVLAARQATPEHAEIINHVGPQCRGALGVARGEPHFGFGRVENEPPGAESAGEVVEELLSLCDRHDCNDVVEIRRDQPPRGVGEVLQRRSVEGRRVRRRAEGAALGHAGPSAKLVQITLPVAPEAHRGLRVEPRQQAAVLRQNRAEGVKDGLAGDRAEGVGDIDGDQKTPWPVVHRALQSPKLDVHAPGHSESVLERASGASRGIRGVSDEACEDSAPEGGEDREGSNPAGGLAERRDCPSVKPNVHDRRGGAFNPREGGVGQGGGGVGVSGNHAPVFVATAIRPRRAARARLPKGLDDGIAQALARVFWEECCGGVLLPRVPRVLLWEESSELVACARSCGHLPSLAQGGDRARHLSIVQHGPNTANLVDDVPTLAARRRHPELSPMRCVPKFLPLPAPERLQACGEVMLDARRPFAVRSAAAA
eukprot:838087-Pyramimonas_sp.AAC.1